MQEIRKLYAVIICLGCTGLAALPTAQAQTLDARGGLNLNAEGFIFNAPDLQPGAMGFTNALLTDYVINLGQLVGHYADGVAVTNGLDLLPYVGQSLEVTDADGNTMVSLSETGIHLYDDQLNEFVPITVTNGQLFFNGNVLDDQGAVASLSLIDESEASSEVVLSVDGGVLSVDGNPVNTDAQNLSATGLLISLEDGGSINLSNAVTTLAAAQDTTIANTDDQTLSLSGTTLTIEDGGPGVDLSVIDTTIADDQDLSLEATTLNIDDGTGVDLGATFATDTELTAVSNTLSTAIMDRSANDPSSTDNVQFYYDFSESLAVNNERNGGVLGGIENLTFSTNATLGVGYECQVGVEDEVTRAITTTDTFTFFWSGIFEREGLHTLFDNRVGNQMRFVKDNDEEMNVWLSTGGYIFTEPIPLALNMPYFITLRVRPNGANTDYSITVNGVEYNAFNTIAFDSIGATMTMNELPTHVWGSNAFVSEFGLANEWYSLSEIARLENLYRAEENPYDPATVVNTDNQVLALDGATLSIDGGNSVDLSLIDTTIADDQGLSLDATTLNIDDGTGVDLDTTFATDTELSAVSNTVGMAVSDLSASSPANTDNVQFYYDFSESLAVNNERNGGVLGGIENLTFSTNATLGIGYECQVGVEDEVTRTITTTDTFTFFWGGMFESFGIHTLFDNRSGTHLRFVKNGDNEMNVFLNSGGYIFTDPISVTLNTPYFITLRVRPNGANTDYSITVNGVEYNAFDTIAFDSIGGTMTMNELVTHLWGGDAFISEVGLANDWLSITEIARLENLYRAEENPYDPATVVNTDNQVLALEGTTLSIDGGNSVDLVPAFTNVMGLTITDASTGDNIRLEFVNGEFRINGQTVLVDNQKRQQTDPLIFNALDVSMDGSVSLSTLISGGNGTGNLDVEVVEGGARLSGNTLLWTTATDVPFTLRARRLGDDDYFTSLWSSRTFPFAETQLVESDVNPGDLFGRSVALDGDTLFVGASHDDGEGSNSGTAYVFTRSGSTWIKQAEVAPTNELEAGHFFGLSVAIDGDTIAAGAYGDSDNGASSGAVYIFTRSGSTWIQQAKLTASNGAAGDRFGFRIALDGDTLVAGASRNDENGSDSGLAYVFTRSGSTWTEQDILIASDAAADHYFGSSVAVDGNTLVVGAYNHDDSALDNTGAAYVFTRNGSVWTEQAKLVHSDNREAEDNFGYSVALDGDTIAVGALGAEEGVSESGGVYIYTGSGSAWTQQAKLTASDAGLGDYFGYSVALHGDSLIVGATRNDDDGLSSGSAYMFTRSGSTWTEQEKLTASNGAASDEFGYAVDLDGNAIVVGAPFKDEDGTNAGEVYLFE